MKRGPIWTKTLLAVVAYAVTIALVDRLLFRGLQRGFALALSFAVVQTTAIVLMLTVLLTRRGVVELRAARSQHVSEAAAAAIAEHAAGADRLRVLRALRSESPRDVDRAFAQFLGTTRGSMQERVQVLARDAGARLRPSLERAAAATPFDRALLAHETREHALELSQRELPRALASGDETSMIAALDLLRGWRLALSVEHFEEAFAHPSPEVRRRAFLALPYVECGGSAAVLKAAAELPYANAAVREAFAQAAGKLRFFHPVLERMLDEEHEVALAAAFALASTPEGLDVLQRRVLAGNRIAFEAVEKAAIGRLDFA